METIGSTVSLILRETVTSEAQSNGYGASGLENRQSLL